MNRALVVCADDFAMSPGISEAILHLAARRRITATSVMTLSDAWPSHAQRLRDVAPDVEVGLHLDWTSPYAMAAGHGQRLSSVMGLSAMGWFDHTTSRGVIERQLDAFERHWKSPPSHIDGHQHVHQMRGIREPLVDVLLQRYPHALPWLRISRAPPPQQTFKARIVSGWGASALQQLAAQHGIPHADWLLGMDDFSSTAGAFENKVNRWLATCPTGAVMMCHPAQGLDPNDPIAVARTHEWTFLNSAAFASTLTQHGVHLAQGKPIFNA